MRHAAPAVSYIGPAAFRARRRERIPNRKFSDDMRVGIYSLRGARVAAALMGGKAPSGAHLPLKKAAQPPFSMLKNAGLSPAFLK